MQSIATQFNPALCGDIRVPTGSMTPMPLDERKVIARRAAMEVTPGDITNLGIGIPAGIPTVAAEEGVSDLLTLSIESGVNGGIPAQLGDFGLAYNAESIIEQSAQFDFYDGGGLDASFLGLAQTDAHGNVNVSKFNGRPVGCGGFVNITRSTRKLVFCGSFTAGGLDVKVGDGQLTIVKEGKARKFIDQVEQVTFNDHDAALREQQVVFITERAVFHLREDGLELTEIPCAQTASIGLRGSTCSNRRGAASTPPSTPACRRSKLTRSCSRGSTTTRSMTGSSSRASARSRCDSWS
jgi:propionate CoA-transferase